MLFIFLGVSQSDTPSPPGTTVECQQSVPLDQLSEPRRSTRMAKTSSYLQMYAQLHSTRGFRVAYFVFNVVSSGVSEHITKVDIDLLL